MYILSFMDGNMAEDFVVGSAGALLGDTLFPGGGVVGWGIGRWAAKYRRGNPSERAKMRRDLPKELVRKIFTYNNHYDPMAPVKKRVTETIGRTPKRVKHHHLTNKDRIGLGPMSKITKVALAKSAALAKRQGIYRLTAPKADRASSKGRLAGKKGRAAKPKTKPKVHPSKKFKAMVDASLAPRSFVGTLTTEHGFRVGYTVTNRQIVFTQSEPGKAHDLFTAQRILDAASVLFNGKTAAILGPYTATDNLMVSGLKLDVISQYATIKIRNMSEMHFTLCVYKCTPKRALNVSPDTTWSSSITDAKDEGVLFPNSADYDYSFLRAEPDDTKGFKSDWNYEKSVYLLDPAQDITIHVKGPQMVYDFDKLLTPDEAFLSNNVTFSWHKGMGTSMMYAFYPTHLFGTTGDASNVGKVGRFPGNYTVAHGDLPANSNITGLTWETKMYYKIRAPDSILGSYKQTGGDIVEGTPNVATKKKDVVAHFGFWDTPLALSKTVDINEEGEPEPQPT